MDIGEWTTAGEWSATPELNAIYREIRSLGLESNLAELEAFGFTTIRDALSPEVTAKLRDAIVRRAESRADKKLDLQNETELHEHQLAPFLLYQNPVFEEAVLNPKPLALITYLLGQSCWLSSLTSQVKGPGDVGILLHSDTGNGVPAPFAPYSHVANCNYALTEYTEERGALAIVPGSHRLARQPTSFENKLSGNERNPHAVPIEVPAGTAIVWHGNTWHGSFPRRVPGLRVNMAMYFCRQYMAPQELYGDRVPDDLLKRHGRNSRLAQLLGLNKFNGWGDEGPNKDMQRMLRAGLNWES